MKIYSRYIKKNRTKIFGGIQSQISKEAILEAFSTDWLDIKNLILRLNTNNNNDIKYLNLKLKELERKKILIKTYIINAKDCSEVVKELNRQRTLKTPSFHIPLNSFVKEHFLLAKFPLQIRKGFVQVFLINCSSRKYRTNNGTVSLWIKII